MAQQIPNNTNITETINAATTVDVSNVKTIGNNFNTVAKELVKIINTTNSIDQSNLKSSVIAVKNINTYIKDYLTVIGELFEQLNKSNLLGDVDSVKKMFGYIEDKFEVVKEDGVEVKKKVSSEKFLLVDGLVSFCGVFEKIIKIIESIVGNNAKKGFITGRMKIKTFIKNTSDFMKEAVDSLIKMTESIDTDKLNILLGNDIQTIVTKNEYNTNKEGKSELKDTTITDTTQKNKGILDVIEKYVSLGSIINSMEFPNIIKTVVKSKLFETQVNILLNNLKGIAKDNGSEEHKTNFKNLSEIIESLSETMIHMDTITMYLVNISKKIWSRRKQIMKSLYLLWNPEWNSAVKDKKTPCGILQFIISLIHDNQMKSIMGSGEKSIGEKIESAKQNISAFTEMIIKVTSLGDPKLIILLYLTRLTIKVFDATLISIKTLAEKIADFSELVSGRSKEIKNSIDIISSISEIVLEIKKIATSLLIVGLIAVPAIFASIIVTVFVLSLIPFLLCVGAIIKLLERININDMSQTTKSILFVIGTLVVTAFSLIALQFALTKIMWKEIWLGLIWLGVTLLGIAAVTWVITKMFMENNHNIIKSILMMNAIILTMVVLSYSLFAIQFILNKIEWMKLIGQLIGVTLIVLSIAGICILIGLSSVIFGAAIAGISIMSLTILSLLVVVGGLLVLQKIGGKINEKALIGEYDETEKSWKGGIFGTIMGIIGAIGDIAWKTDFLNPFTLAWITIKFMIMTITILSLVIIVELLKSLSSDNLFGNGVDANTFKTKVTTNIGTIFDVVKSIMNLLTAKDESSKDGDKGLLHTLISFISPGLANLVDAMLGFSFVLTTLMTVGAIFLIGKVLNSIATMEMPNIKDINDNLDRIIGCAKNITKMINGTYVKEDKQTESKDGGILSKVKGFFKGAVGGMVDVLSNIGAAGVLVTLMPSILMLNTVVDLIKSIQEITLDDKEQTNITTKVGKIIETAKLVSSSVSGDSKVDTIDPKKVRQFGNFVDDSIKYFKHINKLDVSKVKSLGDMYDKMGQFMEKLQDAPIADIADALVNKISPALSDINESMNKKQTSTTTTQSNTFGTGSIQIPQPATQNINVSQQTPQVDYSTMLENIEDLLEQIKQKLNTNQQLAF